MNERLDDFIGIYTDVYPPGYCKHVIDHFEISANQGCGSSRKQSENAPDHYKSDYQINGALADFGSNFIRDDGYIATTQKIFFEGLQTCYNRYKDTYSSLDESNLIARTFKLQRTNPGQGYHTWHFEQCGIDQSSRALVYILYLNTIPPEEGGETEFLYQKKRYNPVENTLIIWPAAYTHTHRGNPVLGNNSKYIATGWFHIE